MSLPDETQSKRTELQIGEPTITRESIQGLPTIPGYQVLRELGRGGMGVVYEAKHLSLDRTVAIKLMKRDDGLHQARFLAEGQIIAAVKHPNVVEVHDFGECSVGPFIAMEYLTGGSFSQKLKGGTALPPREAAEMIAKIAAGVGAAHDISIVHRDLKPGNVLLDANDNPKVTDFGIAKRTDFDLTLTHEAAGTPSYMAPEQARAMKFVGPPADVWSLGVMLYETLTGRKPFVAETDAELLITIQNAEPPTLRTLTKSIPHDLETICLKCLEKEPERRYPTAKELAADLTAWNEGKPIAARRATPIEKAMLWVRRKPAVAGLAAASFIILLLATILTSYLAVHANREAKNANDAKAESDRLRNDANREALRATEAKGEAEKLRQVADARRIEVEEYLAEHWKNDELFFVTLYLDRRPTRDDLQKWESILPHFLLPQGEPMGGGGAMAVARHYLAFCYLKLGEREEARKNYDLAIGMIQRTWKLDNTRSDELFSIFEARVKKAIRGDKPFIK